MTQLNVPPRGPFPNRLMILGEAPGRDEEGYGKSFVGASGKELMSMLTDTGFDPNSLYFTNVFKTRPPGNKVEAYFVGKRDPLAALDVPPWGNGKYLDFRLRPHLDLLAQEIALVQPELIIALGKTALWATTGLDKIAKFRGVFHPATLNANIKVLPTYHPAYILRQYGERSVGMMDLEKAKKYLDGELEAPRSDHVIHINPTVADLDLWVDAILAAPSLAVDVETHGGQIRTVGFAISPSEAYVFPLWDKDPAKGYTNYWDSADEILCRRAINKALSGPSLKIFHNCLYDIQYLYAEGFTIRGQIADTMLIHHALQPELEKSLGFLASIYLNNEAWKEMRSRGDREDKADA